MARTDPRPHTRKGKWNNCRVCSTTYWLYPSKEKLGGKYCSHECYCKDRTTLIHNEKDQLKRCARCNEWKPFSDFAQSRGKRSGPYSLQAYCQACALEKSYEWASNNKDAKIAHRIRHYKKHAERLRAARRNLSPEQRAKKNERIKVWRKLNAKTVRQWNLIRVHRNRAAGEMPNRHELDALYMAQDGFCPYCHLPIPKRKHLDHKTPVSRGGSNALDNLQWTCGPCNMKKGSKTHAEYCAQIGMP